MPPDTALKPYRNRSDLRRYTMSQTQSLVEIAKARQEREAIEASESDSTSSLSQSGGGGAERRAQAAKRLTGVSNLSPPRAMQRLARSSTLSPPRSDFGVSPRLTINTQNLSREIIFEANTPRVSVKAPHGEGKGGRLQPDVHRGNGGRESTRHCIEGARSAVLESEPAASVHESSAGVVDPTARAATETTKTTTLGGRKACDEDDYSNRNVSAHPGRPSAALRGDVLHEVPVVPAPVSCLVDPSAGIEAKKSHLVAANCAVSGGHDEGSKSAAGSPPMTCAEHEFTAPKAMATDQGAGNTYTSNLISSPSRISSLPPFEDLVTCDGANRAVPSRQATAPSEGQKENPSNGFRGDEGTVEETAEPLEGTKAACLTEDGDSMLARTPERRAVRFRRRYLSCYSGNVAKVAGSLHHHIKIATFVDQRSRPWQGIHTRMRAYCDRALGSALFSFFSRFNLVHIALCSAARRAHTCPVPALYPSHRVRVVNDGTD